MYRKIWILEKKNETVINREAEALPTGTSAWGSCIQIPLDLANGLSKSYSNSLWLICYSKRPKYSYKYWQKLKKKKKRERLLPSVSEQHTHSVSYNPIVCLFARLSYRWWYYNISQTFPAWTLQVLNKSFLSRQNPRLQNSSIKNVQHWRKQSDLDQQHSYLEKKKTKHLWLKSHRSCSYTSNNYYFPVLNKGGRKVFYMQVGTWFSWKHCKKCFPSVT